MPHLELSFESGETSLSVRRFAAREAVGELFAVDVWAVSPNENLDLEAIVGRPAAFEVHGDGAAAAFEPRRWSGLCDHAELLRAEPTGVSTYFVRIVPLLWLLTQRRNLRIFQHLSAPDIVDAVLAEHRVPRAWEADRQGYSKLEYKVQYDEDDLAFVRRLLGEAGIAFVIEDGGDNGSRVVLSNKLSGRAEGPAIPFADNPAAVRDQGWITDVRAGREVRTAAVTLRDYDFRNPAFSLTARAEDGEASTLRERYGYRPGSFHIDSGKTGGATPQADDKGTNRGDMHAGQAAADRALAADRVVGRTVSFNSNVPDLRPGVVFAIAGHPRTELAESERLLVTETSAEGAFDKPWSVSGRAVFASMPYFPPPPADKPRIAGVQSAVVVGPPGQEIHTDEHGRVRVQLPWDREGKNDDNSSCWVRVSQGWAGTGFGMVAIPRVGQEVLVGFLDGDPEQPMVVGRVFNARNLVPYKLPDHKTVSTWRTESTPGGGGYNEILFDDEKGKEKVGIRAERDLRKLVKNDETITVGRHRKKLVKGDEVETTLGEHVTYVGSDRKRLVRGDEIEQTEGNHRVKVGKDQDTWIVGSRHEQNEQDSHLTVKGDQRVKVGGARSLVVGGDRQEKVGGRHALETTGELHVKSGDKLVIEAMDLTIAGMGGFIRIDPGGVTIKGMLVKINSGGAGPESGQGASPKDPDPPKEESLETPEMDDVSKTGHA